MNLIPDMRVVVIDEGYPSESNLYGDVFAHARVKEYKNYVEEIIVFADFTKTSRYNYEGVDVICPGSYENLYEQVKEYDPDIILVHFATHQVITQVIEKMDKPYIVWVHGYEALAWYRRL